MVDSNFTRNVDFSALAQNLGMDVNTLTLAITPILAALIQKGMTGTELYSAVWRDVVGCIRYGVSHADEVRRAA